MILAAFSRNSDSLRPPSAPGHPILRVSVVGFFPRFFRGRSDPLSGFRMMYCGRAYPREAVNVPSRQGRAQRGTRACSPLLLLSVASSGRRRGSLHCPVVRSQAQKRRLMTPCQRRLFAASPPSGPHPRRFDEAEQRSRNIWVYGDTTSCCDSCAGLHVNELRFRLSISRISYGHRHLGAQRGIDAVGDCQSPKM